MTALETEGQVCLWCTAALPAGRGRGSTRLFCGAECRQQHHTAVRKLGSHVAADRFGSPGELSGWLKKACTPREDMKSDGAVPDTPIDAPARPEGPEAAPYSFVQFGLSWFVMDPNGLRIVGEPIKTPEAAQRLARKLNADVAKNPDATPRRANIIEPEPNGTRA